MKAEDQENYVEIELPDKVFIQLAIEAHEADITLNDHINKVLLEFISKGREIRDRFGIKEFEDNLTVDDDAVDKS